jgi:sugar lactone lactonase YvrE
MTPLAAQLLHDGKAGLAEDPVWQDGALWWVHIPVATFNRFDTTGSINTSRAR